MTDETSKTAETAERVQRGIEYLRDNVPGGLERINPGMVRASDVDLCPLAQATGKDYHRARWSLRLSRRRAARLGFDVKMFNDPYDWDRLTLEWWRQLTALRLGTSSPRTPRMAGDAWVGYSQAGDRS